MRYLKIVICFLVSISLVGCAVSRNPNPVIRYGANTGATLAGPGFAAMCVAGALSEDGSSSKDVEQLGLFGIAAAAGGFVVGAVLGGTVGFFKWMFNGFENDDIPQEDTLPENVKPPMKPNEYGSKL